ncbi:hypothetical protein ABW21_db0207591 [Orbilia brochopaga]|nr:hypothetical protein ABW21_db0207591 [Drechslerella brochopaga]
MLAKAPSTIRWPSTCSLLCLLVALSPAAVHAAAMQLPAHPQATAITSTTFVSLPTPQAQTLERITSTPTWPATTISATIDGTPTKYTVYGCPTDPAAEATTYTFTTAIISGKEETTTVIDRPCAERTPGDVYPKTSKNSLSSGALAGIAIGISIPILAAIGFFFWRLAKKRRQENGPFHAYHNGRMQQQQEERDAAARNASSIDAINMPPSISPRPRDPDIIAPTNIRTHITAGK